MLHTTTFIFLLNAFKASSFTSLGASTIGSNSGPLLVRTTDAAPVDNSAAPTDVETEPAVRIALTREEGKNEKLRLALETSPSFSLHELPCIAHADGPDYNKLCEVLAGETETWDYIVVTSPEAARVLALAMGDASTIKDSKVAAVGKATKQALEKAGIPVDFVPSKATAACLVEELPFLNKKNTVLYPASAQARPTLVDGLTARGFSVTRLDTYDTVSATWTETQKQESRAIDIVCFASPSAVKGWVENTDGGEKTVLAACIGETSATACESQPPGIFAEILYPDRPGLEGWVNSIRDAAANVAAAWKPSSTRESE